MFMTTPVHQTTRQPWMPLPLTGQMQYTIMDLTRWADTTALKNRQLLQVDVGPCEYPKFSWSGYFDNLQSF